MPDIYVTTVHELEETTALVRRWAMATYGASQRARAVIETSLTALVRGNLQQ